MKNKILLLCTAGLLLSGLSYAQTGSGGKGKAKDSTKTKTNLKPSSVANPCPGKTCGKKKS